ncbi:unnamed protein product [Somion occarium]|uniref:Uncharacterized protein n=1 Tax=Somion occarium TaxID=3059160 RepID=A0ABP1DFF5_9APHY
MNIRTPGKAFHKTPGKTIARNRATLQENAAYYGGAMTVNRKGKAVAHTPSRPAISPRKGLQTVVKPSIIVSRPLGDKTPFPNRQQNVPPLHTPALQTAKIAKLSLLDHELVQTPGHLLRPSSNRKSLRAPRASGSGGKRNVFKTPVTNGNHWDVSDGDIQVELSDAQAETEEIVEDYDEIEYMPPKVPEQPYEPLFPMPDYKVLGRNLLCLAHSSYVDDAAELHFSRPIDNEIDCGQLLQSTGAFNWDQSPLPPLAEGNPFESVTIKPTVSKSIAKPLIRSTTTTAIPNPPTTRAAGSRVPASRPISKLSTRPASSTSTRPPSVASSTRPGSAPSSRVPSRTTSTGTSMVTKSSPGSSTNKLPTPPTTKRVVSTTGTFRKPTATPTQNALAPTKKSAPVIPRAAHTRTPSVAPAGPNRTAPGVMTRSRSLTVPRSTVGRSKNSSPAQAEKEDPLFTLEDDHEISLHEDFHFDV